MPHNRSLLPYNRSLLPDTDLEEISLGGAFAQQHGELRRYGDTNELVASRDGDLARLYVQGLELVEVP